MRRAAVILLLLLTAGLLQTAVFPHLMLAGFRPDVLLLVAAAFALQDGPITGTMVGFFAGLLHDLLLAQPPIGLNAAILLVIGYGVGVARPYLAMASASAPLIVSASATILAVAGYGILSRLLGDPRFTVDLIVQAALVVGIYNTLLSPFVFRVVSRLSTRYPPSRPAEL